MDEVGPADAVAGGDTELEACRRHLPAPVRTLHRWILHEFGRTGTAPMPEIVAEWSAELGIDAPDALAQLVAVNLIDVDPAGVRIREPIRWSPT